MAIFSLKSKEVLSNLTSPANIDLGAMIPIQTITVGAGGVSTVVFSSIPQNYEHLQVRILARCTYTTGWPASLSATFNSDSGNNYARHYIYGDGGSVYASAGSSISYGYIGQSTTDNNTANIFSSFVLDILDYTNTNKYKTFRTLSGFDINGNGQAWFASGLWQSTSAISSITFAPGANNISQYSSFALYGIKRAGA